MTTVKCIFLASFLLAGLSAAAAADEAATNSDHPTISISEPTDALDIGFRYLRNASAPKLDIAYVTAVTNSESKTPNLVFLGRGMFGPVKSDKVVKELRELAGKLVVVEYHEELEASSFGGGSSHVVILESVRPLDSEVERVRIYGSPIYDPYTYKPDEIFYVSNDSGTYHLMGSEISADIAAFLRAADPVGSTWTKQKIYVSGRIEQAETGYPVLVPDEAGFVEN